ncbi:hypothetical protein D3C80_2078750 [compost metagenome]
MLADKPAGVTACRTGFRTEAGAVSDKILRKVCSSQNLLTVIVRYRYFSCRNQIILGIPELEQIFFELGQLACTV